MTTEVIIVGAGLAGLVAAQRLHENGVTVKLLDKGKSVGGRLATRRIGNGIADHGAQFFTARTATFQAQVDAWVTAGRVGIWGYGWSDGSLKRTAGDGHARYIAYGGMNALAKYLAENLPHVHPRVEIEFIEKTDAGWRLTSKDGISHESEILLMTPPVPQSLALLVDSSVALMPDDLKALEAIEYGPCLCGLFTVAGGVDLPEPGAIQNFENTVYWLADNQSKGISPDECIVTLHVEARYSRQHYDDPEEKTLAFLQDALLPHLKPGAVIQAMQLKKWRYSVPLTTHPKDMLAATGLPLYFAGDAFGGRGRVEGAYLSGLAAGNAILKALGRG